MGLLTSLALALIPMSIRSGPAPTRTDELEARISELERKLSEIRDDVARWEALAHRWEARYEEAIRSTLERRQAIAQHQQAQMMAQHAMAQHAPLGLAYQNQAQQNAFYSRGLLGAQSFQQAIDQTFCNCVPARHDMFLGGHSA